MRQLTTEILQFRVLPEAARGFQRSTSEDASDRANRGGRSDQDPYLDSDGVRRLSRQVDGHAVGWQTLSRSDQRKARYRYRRDLGVRQCDRGHSSDPPPPGPVSDSRSTSL